MGWVSDLNWRFCGGRINGDIDNDQRQQHGEYRTSCLWKMEWQSFAKTRPRIPWHVGPAKVTFFPETTRYLQKPPETKSQDSQGTRNK